MCMYVSVITHPNARRPRIEEDLTGMLHVYVNAPPLEGKANRAAVEAIADYYNVKKSAVTLLSGHTSKNKRFEILGL
ncbi:DUF167 domain-containing protein [Patescibacteria group bacterium]|nr:DUF167 domain-containing protein [Patescibacteria group bacterium]